MRGSDPVSDFDAALRRTLINEGVAFDADGDPIAGRTGYVEDPSDPGGQTNYGVTLATARASGYRGEMKDIPYYLVKSIYRKGYWDALHGDDIPDQSIAQEMFDTAVNMGLAAPITFLQRTLNVLNGGGTKYPDVKVDGVMGAATLSALIAALAVAPWYALALHRALDSLQAVRYIELAELNPKLERFVPGWLRNRVGGAP